MDDLDRQFIRARVFWNDLQRLGVNSIICACGESNPACFLTENISGISNGRHAHGACAKCALKKLALEKPELLQVRIANLEKLGLKHCRCPCGESHPLCLDVEHLDGQKFSDKVCVMCRNCHLKRTARQLSEHEGFWLDPENPWALVINKIGGATDHLEIVVANLREAEDILLKLAKGTEPPPR